jgi:hypothetical protein
MAGRTMMQGWGWALVALLTAGGSAEARKVAGQDVPEKVHAGGKTLTLNGTAVQRKLVFDIYAVALFLERPTRDADQAWRSDQTKQLQLTLLRDARKDQLSKYLREGLKKSAEDYADIAGRVEKILAAIPDMKAGETITMTYAPGRGTTLQNESGEGAEVDGKAFADALFGMFLAPRHEMAHIRRALVRP